VNEELPTLRRLLSERENSGLLDCFGYYLYGIVLKELKQSKDSQAKFLRSCHLNPLLWASWMELAKSCEDREMLYNLEVPNHWMKMFYLALACLELHLNEEAMGYYLRMARTGFEKSTYVISQLALAAYNLKDFSKSLERFQELRLCDPYRLNCVDVFSHILFVKEMLPELTILAQGCVEVDRFRFETLCAIANLYSLRGEHEKAVTYFEMAVKVNLADQSACVLLGHEYLELKNLPMAIEAYSRGVGEASCMAICGDSL
jgi:anaphase-promoting complex subunit 8